MEIVDGVRTRLIKSAKFKTNIIGVFFSTKLDKKTASVNALIPAILRRGCSQYPTMRDIAIKLESLYGAKFDCGVSKKGESQILSFYAEVINDKFLPDVRENLLSEIVSLMTDVIFHPINVEGSFKREYIAQEKIKVKEMIETRKNDKVHYALERCYELMCDSEPYGLCEYGDSEEIDKVTERELIEAYRKMIDTFQVDIIIAGDVDEKKFDGLINDFGFLPRKSQRGESDNIKHVEEVREFTEKFNVNQGKLSLGYRVNLTPRTSDIFNMMVLNGILGGGVHSKLFQNVREKNSLAYYVFSKFDKFKNVMGISCGIEQVNYEKALETIKEQVEEIKNGNISENEFQTTIKTIENSIKSLEDEQINLIDYYYGLDLMRSNIPFEEISSNIRKVKISDVIEVAKKIELDTIYFMKGNG